MGTSKLNLGGKPCDGLASHPIQGGVELLSVASCYRNQDKLRPDSWLSCRLYLLHLTFTVKRDISVISCVWLNNTVVNIKTLYIYQGPNQSLFQIISNYIISFTEINNHHIKNLPSLIPNKYLKMQEPSMYSVGSYTHGVYCT